MTTERALMAFERRLLATARARSQVVSGGPEEAAAMRGLGMRGLLLVTRLGDDCWHGLIQVEGLEALNSTSGVDR